MWALYFLWQINMSLNNPKFTYVFISELWHCFPRSLLLVFIWSLACFTTATVLKKDVTGQCNSRQRSCLAHLIFLAIIRIFFTKWCLLYSQSKSQTNLPPEHQHIIMHLWVQSFCLVTSDWKHSSGLPKRLWLSIQSCELICIFMNDCIITVVVFQGFDTAVITRAAQVFRLLFSV